MTVINNLCIDLWQSHVETEYYSIAYFNIVIVLKKPCSAELLLRAGLLLTAFIHGHLISLHRIMWSKYATE